MKYEVQSIPPFDRQLKRLVKKYHSLKKEFIELIESLETNPIQGQSLGNDCYKVRLAVASKRKGKSGGARVITNFVVSKKIVFLISIYDKSEKDSLTDKELQELLKDVPK